MATFTPPPGLVEGTGAYAYLPAAERQKILAVSYESWLADNQTYDYGSHSVPTKAEEYNAGAWSSGLSASDRALLDTYSPGWKSTPVSYQTQSNLDGLLAGAKRKEQLRSTSVSVAGGYSGADVFWFGDQSEFKLAGETVAAEDGSAATNYVLWHTTYEEGPGKGTKVVKKLTLSTDQAAALMKLSGYGYVGGKLTGAKRAVSTERVLSILNGPANVDTSPDGSITPTSAQTAPKVVVPVASAPHRPGASGMSQAAEDTLQELAREMVQKQAQEKEAAVFAGTPFPGYTPIKLRPRQRSS